MQKEPVMENANHWSEQKEKVGRWHIAWFYFAIKVFPSIIVSLISYIVGFCYFLFSKKSRTESRRFLDRFESYKNASGGRKMKRLSALKHIMAFSLTVVEKTQAWGGKIPFKRISFQDDDITDLITGLEQEKGAVLLCSHLGNAELLRALADYSQTGVSRDVPVTSILDLEVTQHFDRLLSTLNPRASLNIINARNINPGSIIVLKEETEKGGLAVIAGDRTSSQNRENVFSLPFLGEAASFPRGPFFLSALLEAPVYAVFALRRKDLSPIPDYNMHVHLLGSCEQSEKAVSRRDRSKMAESWARQFAALLEGYLLDHPYQWYNFYNFWYKQDEVQG
jgi:predicted LPLAT superfamily acyltransferase